MKNFKVAWPKRGHNYLKEEITELGDLIIDHNLDLTQGSNVSKFESEFGSFIGSKKCVALMSAAHALDLIAIKIKSKTNKRKILMPAHTYCATANAFLRQGFEIEWLDIDKDSLTVEPKQLDDKISDDVAAVVIVHLYGYMTKNIQKISETCKDHNIYLVEDCAQSLGAFLDGKHAGNFGDFACFSFHSQKNLTTLGEGGMVVCSDNEDYNDFKELRINGHFPFQEKKKYWLPAMVDVVETIPGVVPMKSTMNESQALIGRLILKRLNALLAKRRKYAMMFKDNVKSDIITFQKDIGEENHAHHLLPIRINSSKFDRDDLIEVLSSDYGINAIVQFYPLNRYHLFRSNSLSKGDLTQTDLFFDNMISVPFSPTLDESDIIYMVKSLNAALALLDSK